MPSSFRSAWSVCLPSTKRCQEWVYWADSHNHIRGVTEISAVCLPARWHDTFVPRYVVTLLFSLSLQPLVCTIERQNIRIARKPEAKHGITEVQVVPLNRLLQIIYRLYSCSSAFFLCISFGFVLLHGAYLPCAFSLRPFIPGGVGFGQLEQNESTLMSQLLSAALLPFSSAYPLVLFCCTGHICHVPSP